MAWMLVVLLVGTFIMLIVLIDRRNRRTASDPTWHTDRSALPEDTSGRTGGNNFGGG